MHSCPWLMAFACGDCSKALQTLHFMMCTKVFTVPKGEENRDRKADNVG